MTTAAVAVVVVVVVVSVVMVVVGVVMVVVSSREKKHTNGLTSVRVTGAVTVKLWSRRALTVSFFGLNGFAGGRW